MHKPFVRYGQEKLPLNLSPGWNVLTFAAFNDRSEQRDVGQLFRDALDRPIHSKPLIKRISPSDRIAVIIEDQTRFSPKRIILRILLETIEKAGIRRENINVIVALGTHRGLTPQEMASVYGEDLVRDYSFSNHDCYSDDLVPIGALRSGTPVRINRIVHEATFKIGIGSVFPHPMNGFGGGGKILFPGVSNADAIQEHHLKYCFRGDSMLGKLEGNLFYEEVCELSKAGGLDFVINSVLDHNDSLYDVVCGDPIDAHLVGTDLCKRIVSWKFPKKSDLTVISAFPYTEGTQIMKPLEPASLITKTGGSIILMAHCTTPPPQVYLESCERFRTEWEGRLREGVFALFDDNVCIMPDCPPELNMSLAQALLAQDEFKIILVSEEINKEVADQLGFFHAKNIGQAFTLAETFCPNPDVNIVPSGGIILPMVDVEGPESMPHHPI